MLQMQKKKYIYNNIIYITYCVFDAHCSGTEISRRSFALMFFPTFFPKQRPLACTCHLSLPLSISPVVALYRCSSHIRRMPPSLPGFCWSTWGQMGAECGLSYCTSPNVKGKLQYFLRCKDLILSLYNYCNVGSLSSPSWV